MISGTSIANKKIGGAVYLLPNLLTTGNLFWGFFSIIKSLQGQFGWAASAVFLAAVFDVLDGRVARLTRSTSEFGVQYDSLCDLVSFGLAPAVLMYQFGLKDMGRPGWIVCFVFLACGALRLARFNVQSSIGKASGDFVGLPIPMAAITIASYISFLIEIFHNQSAEEKHFRTLLSSLLDFSILSTWALVFMGLILAIAMVSNFPYRSHKNFHFVGIKAFRVLALSVALIGLIAYQPEIFAFFITFFYALSGPVSWAMGWRKMTEDEEIFKTQDDSSMMEPSLDND
ncbi:MAG: CDP-diacylglycerol--serine O-phosphatidyltransferase [Oligoflexales bacterium]|nr:CDP-diacylglycerol--serine O-phosphatidyltransferase [Oligoflexales bacterium]